MAYAKARTTLCLLALAILGACGLELPQRAASGQLSMNEMQKRRATERQEKAAEQQALLGQAKGMTQEQAELQVTSLKENPQDERSFYQLMRYYEFHSELTNKDALILWYIEHQPGGKVWPWNVNPQWDRAGYEKGKRLWLAHTKTSGASAVVYERAAAFLEGADKIEAERTLLAGRKAYPDDVRWSGLLGEHYAMVLLGAAEPRTEYNVIRTFSVDEAHTPYALNARAKLEHSNDSRMLAQAARCLTECGQNIDGRISADILTLAESLASRAAVIDPSNEATNFIKFRVLQAEDAQRLMDLRDMPANQQRQVSAADHLLLVRFEMNQAWGPTGTDPNFVVAAAKARDLLELANRGGGTPHSGYAFYEANVMLGKIALRKGQKSAAARYLLAAADAPASEELRYNPLLMNLPRTLIDWGVRDAVAQFLERVAPKTLRAKELQGWAAQIRRGENPDMRPTMIGCGQEPC